MLDLQGGALPSSPFQLVGVLDSSYALFMCVSQDFVVSFFVELSVMMLERLYLDPGAKEVRVVCTLFSFQP